MGGNEFLRLCQQIVCDYFNSHLDESEPEEKKLRPEDVYVVWSCKTLQNNKALLSTEVSDGMYYEITFNGDKNEVYFDAYKKWENAVLTTNPNEENPENEIDDSNQEETSNG